MIIIFVSLFVRFCVCVYIVFQRSPRAFSMEIPKGVYLVLTPGAVPAFITLPLPHIVFINKAARKLPLSSDVG